MKKVISWDKDSVISSMTDADFSLKEWKDKIANLIAEYGEESILYVDAGNNNVSFELLVEEK